MYEKFSHNFLKGNWLSKRPELRSRLIIATKVWGPMDKNDLNARGLSRHHIMCAVEQSLQRLQTDYIDLYQVSTCASLFFLLLLQLCARTPLIIILFLDRHI